MKTIRTWMWVLPVLALVGAASGQEGMGLQRALDRQVDLTITNQPIGEVFAKLTAATGVKFVIDPDTMECLPYGDQTRMTVTLNSITLRKALTPMLAPQALQWVLDGNTVRIVPSDPLFRMGKRATYEEMKTLGAILTARLMPPEGEAGSVIDQLRKATGNKDLALRFHTQADQESLDRANKALPGLASDWLDMLCHGKGWTWYLWGDAIIVVDKVKQAERQLDRLITLRYQNRKLADVLGDLERKSRVRIRYEPGVLGCLPLDTQNNFNLMMARASIAQALEVISGATGLVFERTPDGIYVKAPSSASRPAASVETAQKRPAFMLRMQMPGPDGTTIEVYLRPDDLPLDIVEAIQAEKARMIEKVRQEWKTRGLLPATMPAIPHELQD